jgi:hypothetical protein
MEKASNHKNSITSFKMPSSNGEASELIGLEQIAKHRLEPWNFPNNNFY